MLHNSALDQLIRDAQKTGAFQAKIAYAQFLIQKKAHDATIESLLEEVINNTSAASHYRGRAKFWLGQYYEFLQRSPEDLISIYEDAFDFLNQSGDGRKTEEYRFVCEALVQLYTNKNEVKKTHYQDVLSELPELKIFSVTTSPESAEFQYKRLRLAFESKVLSTSSYINKLKELSSHPETTETLSAKILFQLIRARLVSTIESNSLVELKNAKQDCLYLAREFPQMKKGKAAAELSKLFISEMQAAALPSSHNPETTYNPRITTAAKNILQSPLFKKKDTHYGSIDDASSTAATKIKTHYLKNQAYGRVLGVPGTFFAGKEKLADKTPDKTSKQNLDEVIVLGMSS